MTRVFLLATVALVAMCGVCVHAYEPTLIKAPQDYADLITLADEGQMAVLLTPPGAQAEASAAFLEATELLEGVFAFGVADLSGDSDGDSDGVWTPDVVADVVGAVDGVPSTVIRAYDADQTYADYDGALDDAPALVFFLLQRRAESVAIQGFNDVYELVDAADARKFLDEEPEALLMAVPTPQSPEYRTAMNVGRRLTYPVGMLVSRSGYPVLGIDADALPYAEMFHSTGDTSRYTGDDWSEDALLAWFAAERVVSVTELTEDVLKRVVSSPTSALILCTESAEAGAPILATLREVAPDYADTVTFHWSSRRFYDEMTFPTLFVFDPDSELESELADELWDYDSETDSALVAADTLRAFLDSFVARVQTGDAASADATYMSEDAPADNDGAVTVVTADTFAALVHDAEHDVLVKFYAPWCPHCQEIAPIYEAVGERVAHVDTLRVATFNLEKNSMPSGVQIEGIPTVMLFPATNKRYPVTMDVGARTEDGILSFAFHHSAIAWELDGWTPHAADGSDDMSAEDQAAVAKAIDKARRLIHGATTAADAAAAAAVKDEV